jgi:hypothetical protein
LRRRSGSCITEPIAIGRHAGSLAGNYVSETASATIGIGVSANSLVGGPNGTITLQPLSVGENQGLNLAAGIAAVTLPWRL